MDKKKREPTDPNNRSFIKPDKQKRPMGAPPIELTPELQESVCSAIRMGVYVETAANLNGIGKTTLYKWFKDKRPKFREFTNAVQKALATSEVRDIQVIDKEATGRPAEYDSEGNLLRPAIPVNWKAAAWRLERKHSDRWGRREQVKIYKAEDAEEFKPKGSHEEIMDLIEDLDAKRRKEEESE